jgi:hypothetical protein
VTKLARRGLLPGLGNDSLSSRAPAVAGIQPRSLGTHTAVPWHNSLILTEFFDLHAVRSCLDVSFVRRRLSCPIQTGPASAGAQLFFSFAPPPVAFHSPFDQPSITLDCLAIPSFGFFESSQSRRERHMKRHQSHHVSPRGGSSRGLFDLFEIATPNIWLPLVSLGVGALLVRFRATSQAAERESAYCATCLGSTPKYLQTTSVKEFGCRRDGRISPRNDLKTWQSRFKIAY